MTPTFRFAPSPNGELHLGHAYSAMLNARLAAGSGGRFLLRIEDIDTVRCTPEFEAGILRDLAWLGLAWEQPVRRQSEHFADYEQALRRLVADGLVYPAFMSRGEVRAAIAATQDRGRRWPRDPDGVPHYPPADRRLGTRQRRARIDAGDPFAWRLDMGRALGWVGAELGWTEYRDAALSAADRIPANPQDWGDVLLGRRDITTSYHLSVVLDDAVQGITHVVRGQDLRAATSVHRLLQSLFGLPEPVYFHHRLSLDEDGQKLSKSLGHTGLAALRAAGTGAAEIRERLGFADVSPSGRSRP